MPETLQMSTKTIAQALLPQFDKVCESVREIIEMCPTDTWARDGAVGGTPLRHVYHTIAGLDFYCRKRAHVWDDRFKAADGHYSWDAELVDPPAREEMLAYLQEVHGHRLPAWRQAARAGVAAAQWLLGRCYHDGLGVPREPAEAFRWYQKAAEQGYAPAENSLGICYSRGDGTRRDPTQAVRYYLQAARRNYASAQYNLGICYEVGRERAMFQDRREAVRWFREAAKQQYAPAQNHLGYCYSQGLGVPHDLAEAVRWYRKAAEQGFARAQHNLGICYQTGRGVTRDLVEAQKWFRQAAEQGVRAPSGQKAPQEQDESRDPSSFWSELLDFFKEA